MLRCIHNSYFLMCFYQERVLNFVESFLPSIKITIGTSLVAQWIRIFLPMQGTRVQGLVREDPTCRGTAKPVHHNYWACALEPASHSYWAHVLQLLKPARLEPMLCNKRNHRNEKPTHCNEKLPPLTTTRESPRAATKTQHSQKKKKKKIIIDFSP